MRGKAPVLSSSAPSSYCDRLQLTRTCVPPNIRRSEERRVGKECRSRCDWSSDVCSSDLLISDARQSASAKQLGAIELLRSFATDEDLRPSKHPKIGRASCRERV